VHKTFLGVCMRLVWLSYFDQRKECGKVWWDGGDLTDTRMWCPCCSRDTQSMECPLKGQPFICCDSPLTTQSWHLYS
jgi:hypothetical protein